MFKKVLIEGVNMKCDVCGGEIMYNDEEGIYYCQNCGTIWSGVE